MFEAVLEAVRYDKNQPNRDEEKNEPWNDIELLLSLCDQYIALFPNEDRTGLLKSFLEQSKKNILDETNFTDSIDTNDWASHDKFIRTLGRRIPKQQRLKLFTTNYDLAFEHSAANTGFVVVDGFSSHHPVTSILFGIVMILLTEVEITQVLVHSISATKSL